MRFAVYRHYTLREKEEEIIQGDGKCRYFFTITTSLPLLREARQIYFDMYGYSRRVKTYTLPTSEYKSVTVVCRKYGKKIVLIEE